MALALAVGIVLAVNFVAFGVVYDAVTSSGPGLSDNATQVLTSAFAGGFGVIGSYIGFRYGSERLNQPPDQNGGGYPGAESGQPEGQPYP